MTNREIKIMFLITMFSALIPTTVQTAEGNHIHCTFNQTDSSYSFYGSFRIDADPKCLLQISFYYKHIRALATDAKVVLLIDSGSNWNRISYMYQKYFFFENTSVWLRKLNQERLKVDFTLVSSHNNNALMPILLSSSGYYQIKQDKGFAIVEYYQECRLTEKSITKFYLNRMKSEAIQFINRFALYASEHCSRLSLTN